MRLLILWLALLTTTLALPAQRGEGRRPRDEAQRVQRDDGGNGARAERREAIRRRVMRAVEEGRVDPQQVRERIRERMQQMREQGRGPRAGQDRLRGRGAAERNGRAGGRRPAADGQFHGRREGRGRPQAGRDAQERRGGGRRGKDRDVEV